MGLSTFRRMNTSISRACRGVFNFGRADERGEVTTGELTSLVGEAARGSMGEATLSGTAGLLNALRTS